MLYLPDYLASSEQFCEAYIEAADMNDEIDPLLHFLNVETGVSCGNPATPLKGILLRGS
jgi:hypothetical protein